MAGPTLRRARRRGNTQRRNDSASPTTPPPRHPSTRAGVRSTAGRCSARWPSAAPAPPSPPSPSSQDRRGRRHEQSRLIGTGSSRTKATTPTILDLQRRCSRGDRGPSCSASARPFHATDANNSFPAEVGGYGKDDVPNGLHGSTVNGAGYGVVAANLATAAGADGADEQGAGHRIDGAHVQFVLAGAQAGPAPGTHGAGELYVDSEGTLWYTVPATDGGTDRGALRQARRHTDRR